MGKGGNILTFGAIDTPSLDYVKPRWKMIDFALKNNPEDLKKAEILYDKIVSKIEPGYKPGDKYTTNEATANELRELYKELDKIIQPYGLGMKNGGGTGYNKLYNTKALLDKNVRTVLYGSVGNDPEGEVIRKKMKAEGIELVDNGEVLTHTREVALVTPKDSKDRIGIKFPYQEPDSFHDYDKMLEFAKSCDYFYLESSLIKFLGPQKFTQFVDELNKSGTNIIYAPPTDKAFFTDKEGKPIWENIKAFRFAANAAKIITMNETEAVWFMGGRSFNDEKISKDSESFKFAENNIRRLLKKYTDKLVLVTLGDQGARIYSGEHMAERAAIDVPHVVNTVGCGDASAAAAAVRWIINKGKNVVETLKIALDESAKLASAVVQQLGAQVPKFLINAVLNGTVPTNGPVHDVVPNVNEKGIAPKL